MIVIFKYIISLCFHVLKQMKKRFHPVSAMQRLDQMLSKLRDHDFRITPQRLAVLKVLAASDGLLQKLLPCYSMEWYQ
jgi:hypothetical protein